MEKWSLKPSPTDSDERRHVLHFQGDMRDVVLILQRFGAICGRPDRNAVEPGYNFKVYVNKPGADTLESLSTFLDGLVPPLPAPIPEIPEIRRVEASPEPPSALPDIEIRLDPPVPAPEPPPAQAEPVPLPEIIVEEPPSAPPPSQIEQVPLTEPIVEGPPPAPPLEAQPAARAEKPLWGVERPLDSKRNFDALLVGSYNRFAHAAATSVVGSPGSMYNPLFIHGGPGVGKTHMLNAIGSGLAKAFTAEKILLTSGTRLSVASAQAMAAGRFSELEALVSGKKCLLVDDLHLLAATEASQGPLGKLFAHFLGQNLQVVITSLYPARALGALEEALKISLARGSAVEMKIPGPEPQKDMVLAAFSRHGLDLSNDENAMFHEKLGSGYFESLRWARRLLAFKDLRAAAGAQTPVGDLIGELFTPVATPPGADMPTAADLEKLKGFSPPDPAASGRGLAVLYPKGSDALANWMIYKFYLSAAESHIAQAYRHVLVGSYDPEQPFGVPFSIGEMCRGAGAEAALILGPGPQSKLSERTAEFAHAVKHILTDQEVAMAWIPYAATTSPVPYLLAHLDFNAQWTLPACE